MARRSVVEVATGIGVLAVAAGFLAYAVGNTGRATASGIQLSARFDNVGSLAAGADVKVSGVPVGRVLSVGVDPQQYTAVVRFTVTPDLKLATDSSAQISTGGLLGGAFLTIAPGGATTDLKDGGTITITQSAQNLEDLLGKFIFNVGNLADATQKSLQQREGAKP
jgi:phospholipid/cholesterol/gamma-HCH transport system substrate-binding protein